MKELSSEQMIKLEAGTRQIDWCAVGRGISGVGSGLLAVGIECCCPVAGAAFAAIVITTALCC